MPTTEKIMRNKMQTNKTFAMLGMLRKSAFTTSFRPGRRLMNRSGRSARSVRRLLRLLSEELPGPIKRGKIETQTMEKSRMFHESWRYVPLPRMNPRAMILIIISAVNTRVKVVSKIDKILARLESGSRKGLSTAKATLEIKIRTKIT